MCLRVSEISIREWDHPSYKRFLQADGEVGIAIGEDGRDTIGLHAEVLAHAIQSYCKQTVHSERLKDIDPLEIDAETFHGTWFDGNNGLLVHKGTVTTKDDRNVFDPYFVDVADYKSLSSGLPELWQPGGFAYAFCNPPYGLRITRSETQELYTSITSELLSGQDVRIYNWHQRELIDAVPELAIGTEWWGVFAFTIFIPASSRIFGIVASTSD